jgi:hypothetical protein
MSEVARNGPLHRTQHFDDAGMVQGFAPATRELDLRIFLEEENTGDESTFQSQVSDGFRHLFLTLRSGLFSGLAEMDQ